MKNKLVFLTGVLAIVLTGCNSASSNMSAPEQTSAAGSEVSATGEASTANVQNHSEMVVSVTDETFDTGYANCLKDYFTALDQKDFEGYKKTVYPAYQEVYDEFLKKDGSDIEKAFYEMRGQFDEDGYDSWYFSQLDMDYCENEDIDNFFDMYQQAGIFDEAFEEQCRKDAVEMRDIQFSLYAMYSGDKEATLVVPGGEIIVMKDSNGNYYLFG